MCDEVQKRVKDKEEIDTIDTIEELNNRVNVKNVSEGTMAAVIVRIRKEVTGSYKLKR